MATTVGCSVLQSKASSHLLAHGLRNEIAVVSQLAPRVASSISPVGFQLLGRAQEDHLFLSEWGRPLTSNSITLLFDRIKKRAGISDKPVSPSVLRDTYAVRYLQAGGQPEALLERLGLHHPASITQHQRYCKQLGEEQKRKEPPADHRF